MFKTHETKLAWYSPRNMVIPIPVPLLEEPHWFDDFRAADLVELPRAGNVCGWPELS